MHPAFLDKIVGPVGLTSLEAPCEACGCAKATRIVYIVKNRFPDELGVTANKSSQIRMEGRYKFAACGCKMGEAAAILGMSQMPAASCSLRGAQLMVVGVS